jgi:hypothetical protein
MDVLSIGFLLGAACAVSMLWLSAGVLPPERERLYRRHMMMPSVRLGLGLLAIGVVVTRPPSAVSSLCIAAAALVSAVALGELLFLGRNSLDAPAARAH